MEVGKSEDEARGELSNVLAVLSADSVGGSGRST